MARAIHHVKSDGCAEIHHHGGRAEMMFDSDGVGQPVRADGPRLGVINAHAAHRARGQFQANQAELGAEKICHHRRDRRHDAAKDGASQSRLFQEAGGGGLRSARAPLLGQHIGVPRDAPGIGQAEVRVRVADVKQSNHPGILSEFAKKVNLPAQVMI
jgi:hypothetical protein